MEEGETRFSLMTAQQITTVGPASDNKAKEYWRALASAFVALEQFDLAQGPFEESLLDAKLRMLWESKPDQE